tara:strand:+ start:3251 stop:3499 length:249 start_codon:yes stop_codon:yes gene_type:complete
VLDPFLPFKELKEVPFLDLLLPVTTPPAVFSGAGAVGLGLGKGGMSGARHIRFDSPRRCLTCFPFVYFDVQLRNQQQIFDQP